LGSQTVRVGVAQDQQLVLDAICKLLERECEIVGTASDGEAAVALALEHKPDVLLIDFTLPGLNGLEAARQIKKAEPDIKIIFVTAHTHAAYAREAFNAGASGYVLKQTPAAELFQAIGTVAEGAYFLASPLAEKLSVPQTTRDVDILKKTVSNLTSRQREVLQLIGVGMSRKEIAEVLHVSMKTVEFHKNQLKRALNVRNTAALIRYAIDSGFVHK
jgi:DNA-binding NarL/FixJ family response regulator